MIRRCTTSALLVALACAPASAAVYVVDANGSDQANGSPQAPWKTLQYAANHVAAGDTVQVHAGTYVGFDLRVGGRAGSPITFVADPGVTINLPNNKTGDGVNVEGVSYVVIQGFRVVGMPRNGLRAAVCDHVTFRGNSVDAPMSRGILTGFCNDLLIENNVTSRAVKEHGIYVSNSAKRYVVRNNVSFGNRSCGIHNNGDISLGGDGINSGALIEGNVLYGNGLGGGSAINCDGLQNSVIQNNLIYDQHASGISLYRIDGGGASTGNLIVNNTIVLAADGRWDLNIQNAATGNTAVNNILQNANAGRGSISISADSLNGFVSDYNAVVDRFTTDDGNSLLSLASWRMMTGQDKYSFLAAPAALWVNAAANDHHLAAMSPAIDTGTPMKAPGVDIEGNRRPVGGGFDVGAYERCDAPGCGPPDGGVGPDLMVAADASIVGAADASMLDAAAGPRDIAVAPVDAQAVDAGAAAADLTMTPAESGSTPGGCGCQVGAARFACATLLLPVLALLIRLRRRRRH